MSELRFTAYVGRFVASQVERGLRDAAHSLGLTIQIERHMGLLEGMLLVTAEGAERDLRQLQRWVERVAPRLR